jgi:serine/threonine protein kinase
MAADAKTVKALFLAALDKPTPTDRAGYLDEACAGDAALRRSVEVLLQSHDRPDALLDQPAARHLATEVHTSLAFLQPCPTPGTLGRLGHYEVLEFVGQGGMGVVVRAFDGKLHRVVAIKALHPALAGNAEARQRFVREAQAAAAVTHDNVISIHAVEDGGPIPYLVMQFIDGRTLQQKLDRGGPLPLKEVLRIGLQIAEGLAAAHRQGLIHRDIKPANILLENGIERVKITDFGLARTVDDASLTRSGYIVGTPAYMSPEQANGDRVDHRSDLFSLGSVLYALCAGQPPFRADSTMGVLKRVCEETPRPLRELNPSTPEWLQALIAKLHAKNPADRYGSAAEVAALLGRRLAQLQTDGVFSDTDGAATKHSPPQPKPVNRLRTIGNLFGAALVVVAASVAGWFVYQSWSAKRHAANTGTPEPSGTGPNPAPTPAQPVVLKPSRTLMQHANGVRTLAVSRDGKVLASGGLDRLIYLWDTKTWEARGPLKGHTGDVTGLSFSPDGTRLASVTSSADTCLVRVWDVATGRQAPTLGDRGAGMWDVAYSPDGQTLACGGGNSTLHLFDVASGTKRPTVPNVATRLVRTLSFSPDGRRIATGGSGPTQLWESDTGKEIMTQVQLREEMCPTILAGGAMLAGWTYGEGRVTLCDLPSGQVRATWRAHPKTIDGLAASADGRFIASFGNDGVARVWSTADQKEVATLIGHDGPVYAAAFTPDGAHLVTGGAEDHTIRVWELPAVCRTAK